MILDYYDSSSHLQDVVFLSEPKQSDAIRAILSLRNSDYWFRDPHKLPIHKLLDFLLKRLKEKRTVKQIKIGALFWDRDRKGHAGRVIPQNRGPFWASIQGMKRSENLA